MRNYDSLLPLVHNNNDGNTSLSFNRIVKLLQSIWRFVSSAKFVGLFAGILTVIANAAGPMILIYLIQLDLTKRELNGTRAFLFLFVNFIKIPTQFFIGNLQVSDFTLLFKLSFIAIVSTFYTEHYVLVRINQRWFENLSWCLVFFAALRIIILH
jgi:hypothetical protein